MKAMIAERTSLSQKGETSLTDTSHKSLKTSLLIIFTVSGFSALIYESVWSHYLKLILGHAAYAQTLVLAIFMGGMALGALISSHYTERWKNPLMIYAIIEGIIGLFGLTFHTFFTHITEILYNNLIPNLDHPLIISLLKWGCASSLILPQCILLGMTFPLMSTGIIRLDPETKGATLGMLYFTNSIGAAVGVLVSVFFLISRVGLPGTILSAALLNVLLAMVVWGLVKERRDPPIRVTASVQASRFNTFVFLCLLSSFITGTASFFYEIGWIRMLSLVLGSSTQAFEIMLSAFITGLAFGGLWIKRRIDHIKTPLRFAGYVQILMGFFALLTLPVYHSTFDLMGFFIKSLSKTDGGYVLFNILSHSIALMIMLPATFMAGMTLPLFTYALIKRGYGEISIGRVYAVNTIGAIFGIFMAVHFIMPHIGTKGLLSLGGSLDIILGLCLLGFSLPVLKQWELPVSIGISVLLIAAITLGVDLDPRKMASGVYRFGISSISEDTEVLFFKDGKTATISLERDRQSKIVIRTNGKTDAALTPLDTPPSIDEITMKMAAVLPLSMHPQARFVANIGMGSGLTTHTLLGADRLHRVDTVEIEQAMVEAARGFGPIVERAYSDPRSHIYIEDAKTFFSNHHSLYDIIISEPSNPWVSGVANLFSEEFYKHIKKHLQDQGLLVQWLQLYETNLDIMSSVFKALSSNFANYAVFNTDDTNILIIATDQGNLTHLDPWIFEQVGLKQEMARVGIQQTYDLETRRIGDKRVLQPLFNSFAAPSNSDYFPYVSYHAPKSRYLSQSATDLTVLHLSPLPVLELLSGRMNHPQKPSSESIDFTPTLSYQLAGQLATALSSRMTFQPKPGSELLSYAQSALQRELDSCSLQGPNDEIVRDSLFMISISTTPYLSSQRLEAMWNSLAERPCFSRLSSSAKNWLALYQSVGRRDTESMIAASTRILASSDKQMSNEEFEYLLATRITAHLTQGEKEEALSFWSEYSSLYPPGPNRPLYLKMLLALLL